MKQSIRGEGREGTASRTSEANFVQIKLRKEMTKYQYGPEIRFLWANHSQFMVQ